MPGGAGRSGIVAAPQADSDGADPAPRDSTERSWGSRKGSSHLEDLVFLALEQGVELLGLLVGELLQRLLGAVLVVGAGLARVAQLAQVVHRVAADVADRDLALLAQPADDLHQLPAALLGELGDLQADDLSVVVRRQADVGLEDRPLDRLHGVLVVGLHRQQARLGGGDGRELLQGRHRAVVVHHDPVEQGRAGAARAHGAELAPRRVYGLVHVVARVREEVVDDAHVVTRVPTRSPETIRSIFASSPMLKTRIGTWLSMHSDSAVESITFNPRWSASRAVISGMN